MALDAVVEVLARIVAQFIIDEWHLLKLKCRVGKRFLRNPPTLRSNTTHCLMSA